MEPRAPNKLTVSWKVHLVWQFVRYCTVWPGQHAAASYAHYMRRVSVATEPLPRDGVNTSIGCTRLSLYVLQWLKVLNLLNHPLCQSSVLWPAFASILKVKVENLFFVNIRTQNSLQYSKTLSRR
jgi:hypothetical protein